MRLQDFARWLGDHPGLREATTNLGNGTRWTSLTPEARSVLLASLWHKRTNDQFKVLIVTPNYERILQWQARLGLCGVPADRIRLLPSGQSVLFEDASPETVALSDRIGALRFLLDGEPGFVIATAPAALERTIEADVLSSSFISVKKGQHLEIDSLVDTFKRFGYENSEPVRMPGQYSKRGGILDIFPMGYGQPLRLEFFGDEVESLRAFDPMSQRSLANVPALELSPSRETMLPNASDGQIIEMIERSLSLEASKLSDEAAEKLREMVEGDVRSLKKGIFFDRLDLYRPLLQPDSGCAVDLLGEHGLLVLDEPFEVEAAANRSESELGQALEHRTARGEILGCPPHDFMLSVEHFGQSARVLALTMDSVPSWFPAGVDHEIGASSLASYRGQPALLTTALKSWLDEGMSVGLSTDQPSRAKSVLSQVEIFPSDPDETFGAGLHLLDGNLAGGFVIPKLKVGLVTDQEVFGVARLKLAQRKFSEGVPVATVLDLKPGDYVVHINFGIGIFQGLTKRIQEGVEKEYLQIEYAPPDRLFVPADQLDRIQKYQAPEDAPPKVNRLTGTEWKKTVTKARAEAREFARGLIKLYAERKKVQRPSYGPDSPWQAEMEHTFPWVETPSQQLAICDVKDDLVTDYPMDRLVCGDVGFGKTEVAIRAAFKVAQAGKQVAILCPTTILSEQHFRNFSERLAGFPTNVELINRFRTSAEKTDIKKRLQAGDIDIIIGTHALLSDGLHFKDLGLLVIDEEQKFGVKHKEALKEMRVSVDVLTLSATPIPRTLSMAMMQIRQMSLINDPPPGRLPIRTFVRPFSTEVIREALLRELARGGQVYYVYNRVDGIYHVAEKIRKLVPTARVAVGHGQMHERELEPVMVGFVKGEIDILVSTTIVENGLDIPNSNTLIVENADKFGLSQLYQLRGRVGRSDRQAYSYFLYAGSKTLTENATARLQALQDFSHLGSGYSMAFRDLQIRGAGDLLGARQSGQMNAVGFDLYTQLIESEVTFLKTFADGSPHNEMSDPLEGLAALPTIDLPVKALIPNEYIEEEGQRLYYYKQMMGSRTAKDLSDLSAEIEDRYGKLPGAVQAALSIMHLRIKAQSLQIERIDGKGGRLSLTFTQDCDLSPRVFSILTQRKREAYLSQDTLIWPYAGDPIQATRDVMDGLANAIQAVEDQRAALGR